MSEPQQAEQQEQDQPEEQVEQAGRPKVGEEEARAKIEAALYSSGRALDAEQLAKAAGITSKKRAVDEAKAIQWRMKSSMSAIEVVEYPGQRFAMQLKAEYNHIARKFATKPLLSKAALRTLSFIAYFQPISSGDLALRRGSQAYDHLKDLEEVGFLAMERKGRSRIYRTTTEFSEYFGLSVDPQTLKHQLERRALILR
jgi:segregation and condensation protein B